MLNLSGIPETSLVGRILRGVLRVIPPGAIVPILQGPLRGVRWIVGSGEHGFWLGSFEMHKQLLFAQALKPGDVVLDLGANVGFYTILASRLVGPQGKVFAFEPLHRNLTYLSRHLRLNQCTNVTILEVAVCDHVGTARFRPGETAQGGAISETGEIQVATTSLDALYQSGAIPAPHIIKMDIEGAEADVLVGGSEVLQKANPIIFLATHGDENEKNCLALLEKYQYQVRLLSRTGNLAEFWAAPQS